MEGTHTFHPDKREDSILTIHNRLTISDASAGNAVPFYLQETLGGSDIEGQPTLRGFQDYRFRAPDNVLIQVQYDRFGASKMGFGDRGEGFNHTGEVGKGDGGLEFCSPLRIWSGSGAVCRVAVGLGGGGGGRLLSPLPKV